jgi:hypothetical protein
MQKIDCNLGNLSRIETGALQINEDWPGLFIRGDNAFGISMEINHLLVILNKEEITSSELDLIKLNLKKIQTLLQSSQIK